MIHFNIELINSSFNFTPGFIDIAIAWHFFRNAKSSKR